MKITKLVLGSIETNCYVLVEENSGLGAVIDPGVYSMELLHAIERSGMTRLKYIFLTHGHTDHILGVYDLKQKYPDAQIVIHEDDEICLISPSCSLSADMGADQKPIHADLTVKDGDSFFFGPVEVKVLHTPGHTPGSVCYIFDNILFSGDTLFCRTCGRTDLFRGNRADMMNSILKLGKLQGDYIVYPGHGCSTTLDAERRTNRFMRKTEWFSL